MKCPKCGAEICPKCGALVHDNPYRFVPDDISQWTIEYHKPVIPVDPPEWSMERTVECPTCKP